MADLTERTQVEIPLLRQLHKMGWQVIETNEFPTDPLAQERAEFGEVLLYSKLRSALKKINLGPQGAPWLDDARINNAIGQLERLGTHRLEEGNSIATALLLSGTEVDGLPDWDGGRDQTIHFIDWNNPKNNHFLAINQFRVDRAGVNLTIIPDIVLFINGIPVVVIECKSMSRPAPMEEAIDQLMRYANRRSNDGGPEGIEKLFFYNQFQIVTCGDDARVGTISAGFEHFLAWKDTSPVLQSTVAKELSKTSLSLQELLVAGMLRPDHLIDICRNFVLEQTSGGRAIKIVARYQQFRAVHRALNRITAGKAARKNRGIDTRGGVVWHTQGSGKSLTMVFLVRKLRLLDSLKRFKVVVITDRKDLEDQLSKTASLTGETVHSAKSIDKLKELLAERGKDLVFATIQKYQERDTEDEEGDLPGANRKKDGSVDPSDFEVERFPELNDSDEILVLVDEAHRGHASILHANLLSAMPNCARIGFTGTPIFRKDKKRTEEIFGPIIDRYTIKESEADKATVPIRYVGREIHVQVRDGANIQDKIRELFPDRSEAELDAIFRRYANKQTVLEALDLIETKAEDMLRHYVLTVLPNGLKAQVVAFSRDGVVRYVAALERAKSRLIKEIETGIREREPFDGCHIKALPEELYADFTEKARPYLGRLKTLQFRGIISGTTNDPRAWKEWTDQAKQKDNRDKFKLEFAHKDPEKRSSIAFLVVKSMLLTGFDAPIEQALYLDRTLRDQELLQAIARVNRTFRPEKTCGYVVDYAANFKNLRSALKLYAGEELDDASNAAKDFDTEEIPKLRDRCERLKEVFRSRGLKQIETGDDIEEAVFILKGEVVRHEFTLRFREFLESMEMVLPRPEAIPFQKEVKLFGYIQKIAMRRYRDGGFDLTGVGHKVRRLIDEHLQGLGVLSKIAPIPISDANFLDVMGQEKSARARASEMEHALREHIRVNFNQDPVFFKSLADKLAAIIKEFEERWDELELALRPLVVAATAGPQEDESGLDPTTEAPFLKLILRERGTELPSKKDEEKVVQVVLELIDRLQQELKIVDFWRNSHAQEVLRKNIIHRHLNETLPCGQELVPYGEDGGKQRQIADLIMAMARDKHNQLINRGKSHV